MNGLTQTATAELPEDSEILELTNGENPLQFLNSSEKHLPLAMIRGIEDTGRLEGYRLAERRYFDPPRDVITDALDDRERELRGEPIASEPEPETTPVPATDGGTVATTPDETADTVGSDDAHPDVRGLEAGQVLVLERADGTEYIFPAQPESDEPFLCRSFDSEGDERTADPIPLTLGEVASRPINDTDPVPVESIDKRAPKLAATNGGDA